MKQITPIQRAALDYLRKVGARNPCTARCNGGEHRLRTYRALEAKGLVEIGQDINSNGRTYWIWLTKDGETNMSYAVDLREAANASALEDGEARMLVESMRIVRERSGCGMKDARDALAARARCIPCSIEYVRRRWLAVVMPDAHRYPRWTRHQKNGYCEDES